MSWQIMNGVMSQAGNGAGSTHRRSQYQKNRYSSIMHVSLRQFIFYIYVTTLDFFFSSKKESSYRLPKICYSYFALNLPLTIPQPLALTFVIRNLQLPYDLPNTLTIYNLQLQNYTFFLRWHTIYYILYSIHYTLYTINFV